MPVINIETVFRRPQFRIQGSASEQFFVSISNGPNTQGFTPEFGIVFLLFLFGFIGGFTGSINFRTDVGRIHIGLGS